MAVGSASIAFSVSGRGTRHPTGNSSISFSTSGRGMRYPHGVTSIEINATHDSIKESGSILIDMELNATVTGQVPNVSEPITMNMTLETDVLSINKNQNSGTIVMFHSLDMSIDQVSAYCTGTPFNFIPQRFYIELCNDEETEMIERYKGDTYPFEVIFSKSGDYDISGYTFELYSQIGGGTIYTSSGTVIDSDNGFVTFDFDTDAISTAGDGLYEIKALDSDTTTFAHGVFTVLDTLA